MSRTDTLFYYFVPESYYTKNPSGFTPAFEVNFTDSALEAKAQAICKGDMACLFDIASTGNEAVGAATLNVNVKNVEIETTLCKSSQPFYVTYLYLCVCSFHTHQRWSTNYGLARKYGNTEIRTEIRKLV